MTSTEILTIVHSAIEQDHAASRLLDLISDTLTERLATQQGKSLTIDGLAQACLASATANIGMMRQNLDFHFIDPHFIAHLSKSDFTLEECEEGRYADLINYRRGHCTVAGLFRSMPERIRRQAMRRVVVELTLEHAADIFLGDRMDITSNSPQTFTIQFSPTQTLTVSMSPDC